MNSIKDKLKLVVEHKLKKNTITEVKTAQDILNFQVVKNAIEKIADLAPGLQVPDQVALSKVLAKVPLSKQASKTAASRQSRSGDFFKKSDFFDDPDESDELDGPIDEAEDAQAAKETSPEEEQSVESLEDALLGTQQFKLFKSAMSRLTNPDERAESVFNIIKALPKQDDQFIQALKNMLDR